MTNQIVLDRKILAAGAVIAVVFTIGGFIRLTGFASLVSPPSDGDLEVSSSTVERFPAFDMTRSVTTQAGTDVLRLVYTDHLTWRETVVSSTADPSRAGDYQELRNGVFTQSVRGETITSEPGVGYRVPGPWLVDEQWFTNRASAAGAALATYTTDSDIGLSLAKGSQQTDIRFDSDTGIPVSFKVTDSGVVVEHHQITSLTSGGRTIR